MQGILRLQFLVGGNIGEEDGAIVVAKERRSKCRGESWRRGGGLSWISSQRERNRFGWDKSWSFEQILSQRWSCSNVGT